MAEAESHLHPILAAKIAASKDAGGFYLAELPIGGRLWIQTKNREYVLERDKNNWYISGHPKYCPDLTAAISSGSTFGGSMLKTGFIGIGMHLEFIPIDDGRVITSSRIVAIHQE